MIVELDKAALPRVLPLLRQVQALHAEAMPSVFHMNGTDEEYLAHFEEGFDQHGAFVLAYAEPEDRLVGYVYGYMLERAENAFTVARREMLLDQICVDVAHRGQGIGKALIAALEARAVSKGASAWRATHWSFNRPSAALMASAGAEPSVLTRRKVLV